MPAGLTLSHPFGRGLGSYLDHGGGLITGKLNHGNRVERLELDEFETEYQRCLITNRKCAGRARAERI
jgi:hypothetical protein